MGGTTCVVTTVIVLAQLDYLVSLHDRENMTSGKIFIFVNVRKN